MRTIRVKLYGDDEDADIDIYLSVTDDELNVLKTICDRYNKNHRASSRLRLYEKQKMEKEEWVRI